MKMVKLILLHIAISINFVLVLNSIFSKMLNRYLSTLHNKMIDSFFNSIHDDTNVLLKPAGH